MSDVRPILIDYDLIEEGEYKILLVGRDSAFQLLNDVDLYGMRDLLLENTRKIDKLEFDALVYRDPLFIRKNFCNSTSIKVKVPMKEVANIKVYHIISNEGDKVVYEDISVGVEKRIYEISRGDEMYKKYIEVKSEEPITGYIIIT